MKSLIMDKLLLHLILVLGAASIIKAGGDDERNVTIINRSLNVSVVGRPGTLDDFIGGITNTFTGIAGSITGAMNDITSAMNDIVDSGLAAVLNSGKPATAIVELPSVTEAVIASVEGLQGDAKATALITGLKTATQNAQASFLTVMNLLNLKTKSFWICNIIQIEGLTAILLAKLLAALAGNTFKIREPEQVAAPPFGIVPNNGTNFKGAGDSIQWGVSKIRAPQAWALNNGEGCLAGVIDTGVNRQHEALKDAYGGQWLDPYGHSLDTPTDENGHGSHCAGIILGRKYGIGVAPGAKWIACRGLDNDGSGTEAALLTCGEFMLSAKPRPHVVSNSWGGGTNSKFFNCIIAAWKAVGIISVFAIGNEGRKGCSTANSPGDQPGSLPINDVGLISVGSTTIDDTMSDFSSRGPAVGSGERKPAISAPGSDIYSCAVKNTEYIVHSGTSMATPHVAGAICLMLMQTPGLKTKDILQKLAASAVKPALTDPDRKCGLPTPGVDFPNNAFGDGRIDVGAALGV